MRGVASLMQMVLPVTCPVCGAAGEAPCAACIAALRPAPALPTPSGLDGLVCLLAYDGAGRELLARLKYRNHRGALQWLAGAMAASVTRAGHHDVDLVTWAPTSAARRRERGFDQAELLARGVSRRLRVPARAVLGRLPGPPQTGRTVAERRAIGQAFEPRAQLSGTRVLVIDDVVTTGATLSAAAVALRGAGAVFVAGAAVGRTPARSAVH